MSSKMIQCRSCGKVIAKQAIACPACGAKNKKPFFKKWWVWLIVVIVALVAVISFSGKDKESVAWPTNGMGALLPAPKNGITESIFEVGGSFSVRIEKVTLDDFNTYIEKCKEKGFTIEAESQADEYTAYNQDGYKLDSYYNDNLEYIYVGLEEPKAKGTYTWPSTGLATLINQPSSEKGTIKNDSETTFSIYVGDISSEKYNEYINNCIELGFDQDYLKNDNKYTAYNKEDIHINIEYVGFNTMYIEISAPKSEDEDTGKETEDLTNIEGSTSDNKDEPALIDGMRPEFKAAMDSYEEFFDEYCEFMKEFKANPNDLELLTAYADFMDEYTTYMDKLDEWEGEDMNEAELKYYTEVTLRIEKKLLEIAY